MKHLVVAGEMQKQDATVLAALDCFPHSQQVCSGKRSRSRISANLAGIAGTCSGKVSGRHGTQKNRIPELQRPPLRTDSHEYAQLVMLL